MNPVESLRSVLCDPEGNVVIRGSDGDREVIRQALEALAEQPAASLDVEGLRNLSAQIRPGSEAAPWVCKEIKRLIYSAGGAKGNWRCACGDMNAPNETCGICNQSAPQPAEGDGAVGNGEQIRGEGSQGVEAVGEIEYVNGYKFVQLYAGPDSPLPAGTKLYTRPSAAAAVPDEPDPFLAIERAVASLPPGYAFQDAVEHAAPAAPKGGVDAYTFDVIEEAWGDAVPLTRKYFDVFRARLAELRTHSLANQEQS